MPYTQSLHIEQRLNAALRFIRTGRYSTAELAKQLDVSIPTTSRVVAALRERGHEIKAEKTAKGWRYVLEGRPS